MLAAGVVSSSPLAGVRFDFTEDEFGAFRVATGSDPYALHGSAHILGGMLRLNAGAPLQMGSFIVSRAALRSRRDRITAFAAKFDVHIGGVCIDGHAPCGGSGVSFSYGEVPDGGFGVDGAGTGLRLQLLTHGSFNVVARYKGQVIVSTSENVSIRTFSSQQVEVRYAKDGLWVRVAARVIISDVVIPNWAPQSSWRFAFGAETGVGDADYHWIDNIHIEPGDISVPAGVVAVDVGVNGAQFSELSLVYSYQQPVGLKAIRPSSGPFVGWSNVTFTGINMVGGTDYRFSFNGTVVSATLLPSSALACVTPPSLHLETGSVPAAVTSNGQDFSNSVTFLYNRVPRVYSIQPANGPFMGGIIVNVIGSGFEDSTEPRCKFGVVGTVSATVESAISLACHAPASTDSQGIPLEVSLNAQQFSVSRVHFSYHTAPMVIGISPISGPVYGGTTLLISGSWFGYAASERYGCSIGQTRVPANYVNDSLLTCITEVLSGGHYYVEVTVNGRDFTHNGLRFFAASPAELTTCSPTAGPVQGRTLVIVHGAHLDGGSDYRCRFTRDNLGIEVAATYVMKTGPHVTCRSPALISGRQGLSLTLNGQQYTG